MSGEEEGFRRGGFDDCTEVSMYCPVEATVLGYYPNLGSGIFFTTGFALLVLASGFIGVWKKTWTYAAAMTLAMILETLGYVGRIIMNDNPWNKDAFQLQICAIILAPTLICAAIYLTLKHVSLALGPSLSRIPPQWYPRFFLPADLTCLVIQAIGGSVAAAAGHDQKHLVNTGNHLIISGIVLQVVVLLLFGGMGLDYFIRVRRHLRSADADPAALDVWRNTKFRMFGVAISLAYIFILVRCVYRIAEFSGGWGSPEMRHEVSFIILDPTLVLLSSSLLTIFHPGIFFPQMSNSWRGKKGMSASNRRSDSDAEDSPGATTAGTITAAASDAPSLEGAGREKVATVGDTGQTGNKTPKV